MAAAAEVLADLAAGRRSHSTVVAGEKKVREWLDGDASIGMGGKQPVPVREVLERIEPLLALLRSRRPPRCYGCGRRSACRPRCRSPRYACARETWLACVDGSTASRASSIAIHSPRYPEPRRPPGQCRAQPQHAAFGMPQARPRATCAFAWSRRGPSTVTLPRWITLLSRVFCARSTVAVQVVSPKANASTGSGKLPRATAHGASCG